MFKHICQYDKCKKEFESKTARAKYCSNSHRVAAQRKPGLSGVNDVADAQQPRIKTKPMEKVNAPTGLDFSTQMIFKMIEKQRDDYEGSWKDEKTRNEKLRDEKIALEKEFSDFKHESEKQKLVDAKPTGLGALADNAFVKELMPHLAPHVGAFVGRFMNPELPQADETALWLDQQPEEVKNAIRQLITSISTIQDPARMVGIIQQLINVVQKGSVISPQAQRKQTANGGPIDYM